MEKLIRIKITSTIFLAAVVLIFLFGLSPSAQANLPVTTTPTNCHWVSTVPSIYSDAICGIVKTALGSICQCVPNQPPQQKYCANGSTMTFAEIKAAIAVSKFSILSTDTASQTTYHISNSTGCTAPLIAASYKVFVAPGQPGELSTQQFYADSGVVNINVNGNTDITVAVPSCKGQIDLWYQTAPHSFTYGATGYEGYSVVSGHMNTQALCTQCTPNTTKKCVGNAVYNFDSCGTQGSLYQQCTSTQTCSNGQCVNINIACSTNSQCGTNGFTGSPFCQGNSVYQNYITYTCNNPGTSSSYCSNSTNAQKKNDCAANQTCSNGQCVSQSCTPNWQTGSWCACTNGQQTRTVTDTNNCGVDNGKPSTWQSCNSSSCNWQGHCEGDSCTTYDDCDGSLVCNSGKCGPAGQNPPPYTCTSNWQTGIWGTCSNGQQTRTVTDTNNCGTYVGKPAETQSCNTPPSSCNWQGHCEGDSCTTYDDCDGSLVCNSGKCGPAGQNPPPYTCTSNWQTGIWGTCSNGQQTRTVTDTNNCGTYVGKPAETQSCTSTGSCTDTDGGKDYFTKGTAVDKYNTYTDLCYEADSKIFEYYCDPALGYSQGEWHQCANGCSNGACNPSPTQPSGGTNPGQGMVSFTFDDGWQSAYQNALPLLDQYGIKSTQYIISGSIGDTSNGYISLSQILDLQSRGHEIGAHTKTHPDLTTLSPAQLTDEILGSKQAIESMGINPIVSFDYPYGAYNATVEQSVKDSGYLGARTVDIGDNQKGSNPYLLKAMSIEKTTSVAEIEQRISAAAANNTWLILLFHQVDDLGNQYDISPANLSQIVNYIHQNNIRTVKVSEGLAEIAN